MDKADALGRMPSGPRLLIVAFLATAGCQPTHSSQHGPAGEDSVSVPERDVSLFLDVTKGSGLDFTYRNGSEADQYTILESIGGGVALLDFDGDGLMDVFVAGGGFFAGSDQHDIVGQGNRLYKNLGGCRFQDVTQAVGLDRPVFYTHGCAVADYDRDGWPDLLVTGWNRLALYHNEPDGRGGRHFVEVTRRAGLAENLWTTSAAWGDIDGDGYPDLYLCQYVDWSWTNNPNCPGLTGSFGREICPPQKFKGLPHVLYHNNGDGTFTDVSRSAGLCPYTADPIRNREPGNGLGVIMVDVDGDGKPDIYVANDGVDSFLYMNRSSGGTLRLKEEGLLRGVSRGDNSAPNGSMGVDAADYDASGRPSLWVTNFENQYHALYRNRGQGHFVFSTLAAGIGAIGQRYVGFGTVFVDLDNDGREDLVVSNGHVFRHPKAVTVAQLPILLRNQGNGRFNDIANAGGEYFSNKHVGRGLAVGDLDNDGWPDLIVSHVNAPLAILRNAGGKAHWLGLDLHGRKYRDIVGSRVIVTVDGRRLTRFVKGGGSYCSANDQRLLFGLDKSDHVDSVEVVWSWGKSEHWDGQGFLADRYWQLHEDQAAPASWPRHAQ
jgi:hypothetical protein